jgi:cyclase
VFVGGGRQATGLSAVAWAQECAARGVGQILLTSIDRDGERSGFDLELTARVASAVTVPVTASGGAGSAQHFVQLFSDTAAEAGLAAGSIHDGTITAAQVKAALRQAGIPTAPAPRENR